MRAADRLLLGSSQTIQRVREMIHAVAPTRLPVLIRGETGTGKELVATALHEESGRRGPLVAFNVCAIAETMLEDSLFGHVRGAFTGAASDSLGLLREADAGSAFFDEVTGLPVTSQAKLLRVLETGIVRPVGGSREVRTDFRTIAATNENLTELARAGRFRSDLANRLGGVVIEVPPLRERRGDIAELVRHFANRLSTESPALISASVLKAMVKAEWPGNIRELRHVVEAALVFGSNVVDDESFEIAMASRITDREATSEALTPRARLIAELEQAGWDTAKAAQRLQIHRTTVYRWMKRLGIQIRSGPSIDSSSRSGALIEVS